MKVIFTSLGPNKEYITNDLNKFKDGDITDLSQIDYDKAVTESKFAQDYTEDLAIRTKRLLKSAETKRKEVLAKMARLNK